MTPDERLERLAGELGREAGDRVDPERVAARVLARLRSEPVWRPWWRRVGLAPALAAGAVLAVAVGLGVGDREGRIGSEWGEAPLPIAFTELAAAELTEVLDSLDYEAPVSELVPAGLYELSVRELEALLEAMEG